VHRIAPLLAAVAIASTAHAAPDAGPPEPCTFTKVSVDCELVTIDDALAKTLAKHKSARLRVTFGGSAKNADLTSLSKVPWVSEVSVAANGIDDLSELSSLPKVATVVIRSHAIKNLAPLAKLPELGTLMITGMGVEDVAPLAVAPKLRFVALPPTVRDVSPLSKLAPLRALTLGFDAKGVSSLVQLEELSILRSAAKDTSALAPLVGLVKLSILRAGFLVDVSGIAPLTKLRDLDLVDCPKLVDLSPLSKLVALEHVDLTGTAVRDVSPLLGSAKTLQRLTLPEETPAVQLEPFKKINPKLK
jgi:Leucine-rich repeat (LRR) protein